MNTAQQIMLDTTNNFEALELAELRMVGFYRPYNDMTTTRYVFDDNSALTFTFGEFRSVKTIKASK